MVVVVASQPPSREAQPPVFATLYRDGQAACTIALREYGWDSLRRTDIVCLPNSRFHEGRSFGSFIAAARYGHQQVFGCRGTELTQMFKVRVDGPLDAAIVRQIQEGERRHKLAKKPGWVGVTTESHANSRVRCLLAEGAADDARDIPLRYLLPLVPPELSVAEAVLEAPKNTRDAVRDHGAAEPPTSSQIGNTKRPAAVESTPGAEAAEPPSKCQKRVKIKSKDGIVVWERASALESPTAMVVRGCAPGQEDCTERILHVERLRVGPCSERRRSAIERVLAASASECESRAVSELAEFGELLAEIWARRLQLGQTEQGSQIEATVCAALVQRLRLAPDLTARQMWTQRMGDAPCPVLE